MQAAGFVLAGGQSTRMGQNKALLELAGRPLIVRALAALSEVCADVAIAGGAPELAAFGRLVADETPGCGPLGGLVAALEQTAYEWNLFVPVDVPFVPVYVWRSLLDCAAANPQAACVMSRAPGGEEDRGNTQVQPLCAVYARWSAPVLRQHLLAGRWKVTAAIAAAGPVVYCDFEDAAWFRNLNTPDDFKRALPAGLFTDQPGSGAS